MVLRERGVNGWKVKVSSVSSHSADGALWCFDMHLEEFSMFYWLWSVVSIGLYRSYRCSSGVSALSYRSVCSISGLMSVQCAIYLLGWCSAISSVGLY